MSPAKTPKKSAAANVEDETAVDKKVLQLKTGNTATPKKSAASKVTDDGNEASGTPSKKGGRSLKTPSKGTGVEQSAALNTPKGNLGDPSPLQTRSARKKKAALTQECATPKLDSVLKNDTPAKSKAKKNAKKPTPGKPKIEAMHASDNEEALDSDDLDSDDVDDDEVSQQQKIPPKQAKKSKVTGKKVAADVEPKIAEKIIDPVEVKKEKPTKEKTDVDPDLDEAAQTPLPMSPEAPVSTSKIEETKSLEAEPKPIEPKLMSPKGVSKGVAIKPEITSPKVQPITKTESEEDSQPKESSGVEESVVAEEKSGAPPTSEEEAAKSPGKRTKKQKGATKKAKKDESEAEPTSVKTAEGRADEAVESTPDHTVDPEVPSETPGKSPGKRTKGPKEAAKKAKLDENKEPPAEESTGSSSEPSEKSSPKKKEKAAPQERKIDSIISLKIMAKGRGSEEEKLEEFRQKLIDAGKNSEEVEIAIRRFRRILLKQMNVLRCKRCLQRGHAKQNCPHPPRASKCYKCGSQEHLAAKCSIKEAVYTFAECDICHTTGHLTKLCPQKKPKIKQPDVPKPNSGPKCYKCGQNDHNMFSCSIKEDVYPFAKCRVCRKTGHLFNSCPKLHERRLRKLANAGKTIKAEGESATAKPEEKVPAETKEVTDETIPVKSKKSAKTEGQDIVVEAIEQVKKNKKGKKAESSESVKEEKETTKSALEQTETAEPVKKKKSKKEPEPVAEKEQLVEPVKKKKGSQKDQNENVADQSETVVAGKKMKKVKKELTEEVKENVTAPAEAEESKKKKKKNKQMLSNVNASEVDTKKVVQAPEIKKSTTAEEPIVEKKKKKALKNLKVES